MANTQINSTWVLNETGQRFVNSVKGVAAFNRSLDEQFGRAGRKVGDTVQYRVPTQFVAKWGSAYDAQDLIDQTVPVRLSDQAHIDFDYGLLEELLDLDMMRERYINPAADTLASAADEKGMRDVYASVYHNVGTIGANASTNFEWLDAGVKITESAGPLTGRNAIVDPYTMALIVAANQTLFHPAGDITKGYRDGQFADKRLGIDMWAQDQNTPSHTTGSFTSCTPLVNSANQTGASLVTDGWASSATTLKKGDCFTIDGVYKVNPLSKANTGSLMDFVVTADVSDTTGDMTIAISPSIITSGQYQNVSNSPANNAPINVWGKTGTYKLDTTVSRQSLVFHGDAFGFVMADLPKPEGNPSFNRIRSSQYNISMSWIRDFDINTYKNQSRIDILFGAFPLQPRLATRKVR